MPVIQTYRPTTWSGPTLSQLASLSDELGRLFDLPTRAGWRSHDSLQSWMPPLDLRETPDAFVATVELPGMKREQIEVSVHDGVLSIAGERVQVEPAEGCCVYRSERRFGRFQRSVSLPKPVRADATKAVYREGILTVTLPKTEEAKPKQIEVSVG
jgi:HSP20 family protein